MGQQQLLLFTAAVVIVGLAIALAIDAYTDNSAKTNADALFQHAMRVASDAQSWKSRAEIFGGSPDNTKLTAHDFEGLTFYKMGYEKSAITSQGACYENLDGLLGIRTNGQRLRIIALNAARGNLIAIEVVGTKESDISLQDESWNPVINGSGPDGHARTVANHPYCRGVSVVDAG